MPFAWPNADPISQWGRPVSVSLWERDLQLLTCHLSLSSIFIPWRSFRLPNLPCILRPVLNADRRSQRIVFVAIWILVYLMTFCNCFRERIFKIDFSERCFGFVSIRFYIHMYFFCFIHSLQLKVKRVLAAYNLLLQEIIYCTHPPAVSPIHAPPFVVWYNFNEWQIIAACICNLLLLPGCGY